MNEDSSTALATVLDRATDRIYRPDLGAAVLAEARRRRARNRWLAAAGTAAAVAVVLVAAFQAPQQASTPPVTPSETQDPKPNAVKHRWDPFTVVDEPLHRTILPTRLEPPAEAPSVADQPLSAAVVAWPEDGQDLRLLGTDGAWRSVPGTAKVVTENVYDADQPALSSDGRQVAMSTIDGILVVDVTSGEQRTIPWPDEIAGPWDTAPGLRWLPDDDGFAVLHWRDTWLVGLDGEGQKAPYGGPYGLGLAFDPAGPIIERRPDHNELRVWQGDRITGTARSSHRGERMVARHGRVALVGWGGDPPSTGTDPYFHGGPMVLDTATGELLAYAPIRDPNAVYTDNGHLSAKGFLDKDTVLLLVAPMDFRTMDIGEETWHLVAWDIRTGEFERLTTGDTRMRGIDVAGEVLAADWEQ